MLIICMLYVDYVSWNLLNLVRSVLVFFAGVFLVFSRNKMKQFANRNSFWFGWLLVLFLIALAKTSITVLIRSDESGTLFLFLILEGKLSAFTIEYDYIRGFVIYGLSYFEVCFFYPNLRDLLNHKFMLNFLFFFFIYWTEHMIFIIHPVNVVYHILKFISIHF